MKSIDLKSPVPLRQQGFTLIEMLVVIVIMSILMTAGAIGLNGMGGKGVTSGVATVESLFDEARSIAVGNRTRTRVLVAKNLTNVPADNLRRIVVVSEELNADGTPKPESWVLSSRATVLPDQVFFSKKFSKKDQLSGSGDIEEVTLTGVKSGYQGTYFSYEFNAEGICLTPGAGFVLGTGARGLSAAALTAAPKVTAAAKQDFGGFVVWRNGGTSTFRTPTQISSQLSSIKPGDDF
jgi:prepilin-type N-terminal cleavage/methylation domain-containing protein